MAAVDEDLQLDLASEALGARALEALGTGRAKAELRQSDHAQQPRVASQALFQLALEVKPGGRQGFHETTVEGAVAALEDDRRLGQPGEHAPRRDLGVPSRTSRGTRGHFEKFIDEHPRLRFHAGTIGGAQVTQPAESVELPRPGLGAGLEREGRALVGVDDLAAEREIAGADIGRDRRITGADVLGCDQQTVGRRRAKTLGGAERQRQQAAHRSPGASGEKTENAQAIF